MVGSFRVMQKNVALAVKNGRQRLFWGPSRHVYPDLVVVGRWMISPSGVYANMVALSGLSSKATKCHRRAHPSPQHVKPMVPCMVCCQKCWAGSHYPAVYDDGVDKGFDPLCSRAGESVKVRKITGCTASGSLYTAATCG